MRTGVWRQAPDKGRYTMTTLESRLEDYRQQIERLENAVARTRRSLIGRGHRG